ncbi:hypothetical protein AX15_006858 [Amanita polypyramis BW_CC]|nr:hypothetical protein AX15_006858 [Amanita polypyramis BW_CC]
MVILFKFRIVKALRLFWTFLVIWLEYGIFRYSVQKCGWPDSKFQMTFTSTHPTHVLVVADPQILDHRSYPGRSAILTYISQVLVDLNIRKSWREATRLKPDAVVFLGDMMDGGRFPMSDAEYKAYYTRFRTIFTLDRSVPEHFIPGNHDTGLRMSTSESKSAHERYISHFGPLNRHVNMTDHSLVLLDAPGLVDEDYHREQSGFNFAQWSSRPGGPVEFVEKIANMSQSPVILFSHIPLHRPEGADCGPLRERGTIRQGFGTGYQNILGKEASDFLLLKLKPTLVMSGDDHDYCEHNHTIDVSGVVHRAREVTVKSLSMAMNVRRPGFQLLSLLPKRYWEYDATTHADELCLLPDQLTIYLSTYIPLLLISLLIVLLLNIRSHLTFNDSEMAITPYQQHMTRLASRSRFGRGDGDEEQVVDEYYANQNNLPAPAPASRYRHLPPRSWSFVLFGRRRRLSIAGFFNLLIKLTRSILLPGYNSARMRGIGQRGIANDFMHDVGTIAVLPLSTIILISLWTTYF